MFDWSNVLATTGSAVKASVSVILILLYGFLIRRWKFVSQEGENNISKLCVTWFLPCLLFSEIGPLATWDNLKSYWIIIVLSLFFQLCSFLFGVFGHRVLGMPQWIVPCLVFNNVTSLPLLLLDSLGSNGALDGLLVGQSLSGKGKEGLDGVLSRGRVYFLINALVCNLTRFTFGPYLLKGGDSHIWSHFESPHSFSITEKMHDLADAILPDHSPSSPSGGAYPAVQPYPDNVNTSNGESTPLLSATKDRAVRSVKSLDWRKIRDKGLAFMNPPMWGGLTAMLAGLIPFLRHWLFDESGWLKPFAESVNKLGALYTVLQMFVLGAHLYSKKTSGKPPLGTLAYLFVYRFVVIAAISNGVVYGLRTHAGKWLREDPVLDFVLASSPVGPPALTLAAIVEMSDTGEETEAAVAQTILFSYIFTPFISLGVSTSLAMVKMLYA